MQPFVFKKAMKDTLSVITICFNNLPELIRTCQSVDRQSQHPDEHLVIDGSSNTEILNWLQSNPQPAYRKWIHEKDHGIADAFNKGLRNAVSSITCAWCAIAGRLLSAIVRVSSIYQVVIR